MYIVIFYWHLDTATMFHYIFKMLPLWKLCKSRCDYRSMFYTLYQGCMQSSLQLCKGKNCQNLFIFFFFFFCFLDLPSEEQKAEVKIKPRKGRPAKKAQSPVQDSEDDLKGILTTRWIAKEAMERDLTSSPPLKSAPRRWLSSLAHNSNCQCLCCSEPSLARATARWAAAQAELILHLETVEYRAGIKLQLATLDRCKLISTKLGMSLSQLLPPGVCGKKFFKPNMMDDVVARVYLCMASSELRLRQNKVGGVWTILEAGLKFVGSSPSPALRPVKANLAATKAIASLVTLAAQRGCSPEELFASVWCWNPPKAKKQVKLGHMTGSSSTLDKKIKEAPDGGENPKKAIKIPKLKTEGKNSRTRSTKMPPPMTPMAARSKPSGREYDLYDFNAEVPVFACTPVQARKAPNSVQKTQKTASKLHFQVYQESSPGQQKVGPVPAAPKRTKRTIFKVGKLI